MRQSAIAVLMITAALAAPPSFAATKADSKAAMEKEAKITMAAARKTALHTASGNASSVLEDGLSRMGVRELFGPRLYGPDLAGASKNGRAFYERIVALESLDPATTLVVDDADDALEWARDAGLRTHRVRTPGAFDGVLALT